MSQIEALYNAIEELRKDEEFGRRMEMHSDAEAVVRYLVDRGVDSLDAKLLAMTYLVGSRHAFNRFGRDLERMIEGRR